MKRRDRRDGKDYAGFIPPHGGYETLLSFQKAEIVFDATVYFCELAHCPATAIPIPPPRRFLSKKDRTYDQMVQAARSGKQNIVEGSRISATSKKLELNLTNVARAGLEELLTDYRDFLRKQHLAEWTRDHPYAQRLRRLNRGAGANYETFRKGIEHRDPAICANVIIGLIKVASFLLDGQIRALERAFVENGGIREAMFRARLKARANLRLNRHS